MTKKKTKELLTHCEFALGRSPKSLMRMFNLPGNPHIRNPFQMIAYLQKMEGTVLRFEAVPVAA